MDEDPSPITYKKEEKTMGANTTLNTKEITKCTLRFYDADFVKKLNDLYRKVGGTQTSFLGMLVREGYKSVAPLYADINIPVSESVKGVQGEAIESGIKELKDILLEKADVEMKHISNLSDDQESLMKLLACLYNLFLLCSIDDEQIKAIIDQGGFDRIPKRFTKMRHVKR